MWKECTQTSKEETKNSDEKNVQITLSQNAVEAFRQKIVGARQQLRQFMSDMAKTMAQNYKPPITSFRITLNPSGLGNIAVVLKSEKKENAISISLNMSQQATLDTLVDNQAALRAALNRNFDSNTSFSLNFGMQQNFSNQNQQEQNSQNQNTQTAKQIDTSSFEQEVQEINQNDIYV